MTHNRFILCCSGKQTRWNNFLGTSKQLVSIDDERLINRTVRLIKKYNDTYEIIIMTYHPQEFNIKDTTFYIPTGNYESHQSKPAYWASKPIWTSESNVRNIILFGDVYFSEYAMKIISITNNNIDNNLIFYGRENSSPVSRCPYGELWGLSFNKTIYNDLQLYESGWELKDKFNNSIFIEIGGICEDFDYPSDYDNWIDQYKMIQSYIRNYIPDSSFNFQLAYEVFTQAYSFGYDFDFCCLAIQLLLEPIPDLEPLINNIDEQDTLIKYLFIIIAKLPFEENIMEFYMKYKSLIHQATSNHILDVKYLQLYLKQKNIADLS